MRMNDPVYDQQQQLPNNNQHDQNFAVRIPRATNYMVFFVYINRIYSKGNTHNKQTQIERSVVDGSR